MRVPCCAREQRPSGDSNTKQQHPLILTHQDIRFYGRDGKGHAAAGAYPHTLTHTGVQRHEAHTVMTETGPCQDMLHSINTMLNMNYTYRFVSLYTVTLFLHKLIRLIKYMQQKLIFQKSATIVTSDNYEST